MLEEKGVHLAQEDFGRRQKKYQIGLGPHPGKSSTGELSCACSSLMKEGGSGFSGLQEMNQMRRVNISKLFLLSCSYPENKIQQNVKCSIQRLSLCICLFTLGIYKPEISSKSEHSDFKGNRLSLRDYYYTQG